jgi:hypothetical protein
MAHDYSAYIRDVFCALREAAAEARREKIANPTTAQYYEGRETALIEALLTMQTRAKAFMIPSDDIGVGDFDPLMDPLEPPDATRDL